MVENFTPRSILRFVFITGSAAANQSVTGAKVSKAMNATPIFG